MPHIPVDTYERPKNYDGDQGALNNELIFGAGYESAQLRGFIDNMENVIRKYGFTYLNDKANDLDMTTQKGLILAALKKLDNPKLEDLYRVDQDVILKREDVMLDKVYRYAAENSFTKGLMFIGSGHRASMTEKIAQRNETEDIKINWRYSSDLVTTSN